MKKHVEEAGAAVTVSTCIQKVLGSNTGHSKYYANSSLFYEEWCLLGCYAVWFL
jgi:hypothetical protein